MKNFIFFGLVAILLGSCKDDSTSIKASDTEQKELLITEKIAYANGLKEFDKIEELRYTFNVKRNDSLVSSRSWNWKPQVDSVTSIQGKDTVSYALKDAKDYPEIDPKFINDQYWLLFPYHLVWDEMEFEHSTKAEAPISGKELQKMVISYPSDVGYTPGDVYEIYFDDDFVIREWVYMSEGDTSKASPFTWEDYQDINGMRLATKHRNKDGSFELFFTDISVE